MQWCDNQSRVQLVESQGPVSRERWRSFLTRKEAAKVAKYTVPCTAIRWAFTPVTFGTWGGVGPAGAKLLARIVKRASSWGSEDDREIRAHQMRCTIGFALMGAVASLLERKNTTVFLAT